MSRLYGHLRLTQNLGHDSFAYDDNGQYNGRELNFMGDLSNGECV